MTYYVYRMYDNTHKLLYVGRSTRLEDRLEAHRTDTPFWSQVSLIGIEHFTTFEDMRKAEIHQIRNEEPVYNIIHNPTAKDTKPKPKRKSWRDQRDDIRAKLKAESRL